MQTRGRRRPGAARDPEDFGWLKAADMCRELDTASEGRGHIVTAMKA